MDNQAENSVERHFERSEGHGVLRRESRTKNTDEEGWEAEESH